MEENHLIQVNVSNGNGNSLIELSAHLTLSILDDDDSNLNFRFIPIVSSIDEVEFIDTIKYLCYDSLSRMVSKGKCVYFLIDKLVIYFDSGFYNSQDVLRILANIINIFVNKNADLWGYDA